MFEKMTDSDVMVYLRNSMLALSQLAQERDIKINIDTGDNGYARVRAGEYTITKYSAGHIEYSYEPIYGEESTFRDWKSYIPLQTIRFGQEPKEGS